MSSDGSDAPPRPRPRFDWVPLVAVGLVALVTLAVVAVFILEDGHEGAAMPSTHTAPPPLDLATVTRDLAAHYEFAAAHADVYAQIPCYCGCDRTLGHRNLEDCFVRADGRGWDAHAAGCAVCTAESTAVRDALAAGATPGEIRAQVIAQYGSPPNGFASPANAT